MKRNKGFTLVELLAVIVILAIILAIAIPSITNVVNSSRLSSFAVSSDMLERAAKTYLSVNNTSVASGTTSYILYSDMKTAGYINKVVDPTSKNECTHSGVYVTNNSGTYTYKGALACDNYMDIDSYNLITNSDFSISTTGWGADGVTASIESMKLKIVSSASNAVHREVEAISTPVANHKYYYRGKCQGLGNGKAALILANKKSDGTFEVAVTSDVTTEAVVSSNLTVTSLYSTPNFAINLYTRNSSGADTYVGAGEYAYFDDVFVFDLTSIYGAGNEPTTTQMDNIMSNMGK